MEDKMDYSRIKTQVHQILGQYIGGSFTDKDDVVAKGFVNSLEATQITLQLESAFKISISDAEAAKLRTVESISLFIQRKLG
jgi:acyl carrier protein